jgi:hypothetical protein
LINGGLPWNFAAALEGPVFPRATAALGQMLCVGAPELWTTPRNLPCRGEDGFDALVVHPEAAAAFVTGGTKVTDARPASPHAATATAQRIVRRGMARLPLCAIGTSWLPAGLEHDGARPDHGQNWGAFCKRPQVSACITWPAGSGVAD